MRTGISVCREATSGIPDVASRFCKKVTLTIIGLILATSILAQDRQSRDPDQYFFEPSFKDLQEELSIAKQGKKDRIAAFFRNG